MSDAPPKPETAKKGRKRRRRTRRKRDEPVGYELRVSDWDYYYGFSVSDPKSRFDTGPYRELATLTFKGALVRPEGLPYREATLTLSARAGMMDKRYDQTPHSIGGLSAYGETLNAYVFIPVGRLAELTAVALSGRVQVVNIVGTRLRYRSGSVQSISLNTEIEEEEDE